MVCDTTFYETLSVPVNASVEAIAKAYRRLALKCHPDKTNHDPQLTEKFKEMTKAYEVLKDVKQRNIYDHYGVAGLDGLYEEEAQQHGSFNQQSQQQATRACHFSSAATDMFTQVFSDINNMFAEGFGSGFPNLSRCAPLKGGIPGNPFKGAWGGPIQDQDLENMKKVVKPAPPVENCTRGEDIHHTCNVLLGDLHFGKTIKLQLPKTSRCVSCEGMGGFRVSTCTQCQGSGQVVTSYYNQVIQHREVGQCNTCQGTGLYISPLDYCTCNRGFRREKKLLKVTVLPGLNNGDKIILQGEGDEGRNIIPGDVIIHLREIPHPFLVRKYNDLYMEHEIDLRTALLGGTVLLNDFLRPNDSVRLFLNVHGIPKVNSVVNESLKYGEVLGTIDPNKPKIVKGLGMPINEIVQGGEYVESTDSISDVVFDLKRYRRGHLFISFKIKLPSFDELTPNDLLQLERILPKDNNLEIATKEAYVSNLPGDAPSNKPRRSTPFSSPTKLDGSSDFNYDDIDITDDLEGENEEEDFYNKTWIGTPQPNFESANTPFDLFTLPLEGEFSGIPNPKKRKHDTPVV